MRGAQVEVREKSNGEITIEYKQRPLEYSIYCEQEQQQAKVVEAKTWTGIWVTFQLWVYTSIILIDFLKNEHILPRTAPYPLQGCVRPR